MDRIGLLHKRLDELAVSLKASGTGLGLLGLGSVGYEIDRLDRWSDLDFFAFVKPGTKASVLADPAFLRTAHPISWLFRNTPDGFKVLFNDGIFAEMAVFEPHEVASIPYSHGRWIWRDDALDEGLVRSQQPGKPVWLPESPEWALGELLSCLLVGLSRFRRGERLSAWRFVQGICIDRFLELVDLTFPSGSHGVDYYSRERRWEARHPDLASVLDTVLTGYNHTPRAALAMLTWLEKHFEVNHALAVEIRQLAKDEHAHEH